MPSQNSGDRPPSADGSPADRLSKILLGDHHLMHTLRATLLRYASGMLPVLLLGERGTGKELAARALHDFSCRSGRAFILMFTAALPETLLDSDLFGHVRGAFSNAHEHRTGRFLAADKGTAFLDEVGDLSQATQMKLLRVTESGEFSPLGSNEVKRVDVRLVAATHRDLPRLVSEGLFREDLYDRLKGIAISLPPLRSHLVDVPLYVSHFLDNRFRIAGGGPRRLADGGMELLLAHSWPGNVRELRQVVLTAAEGVSEECLSSDLVREAMSGIARPAPVASALTPVKKMPARSELLSIIEEEHWVLTKVKRRLGVARSTVYEWMGRLGISR